ncbi:Wzz/FepE/Etk N-terminal domain-containing protein [Pseudomonas donghuensis]|uniref:Wzz/FepE/Etk N-terminal domain-containing protein n=1 Tax=Pseudomonas donghuensis TaxID=1163398 RepID=UPI000C29D845|nr:Wzz/FepE/Etk N-terminal domain-containing protein [Pseudomonas donghuensis]PJY97766.1 O-antigen chain length regulator [Pseudomonas donghuensis]WKY27033.1 Wzz/FepE/Etk N-terminal domain-containing protein [Pseudomonas donghuensis]
MTNAQERLIEDERDLIELVKGLWQQKVLILVTATVVTLVAVVYVLLATPIYESKVFIEPPTHNDIAHLNYGRGGDTGLETITVKDVYDIYLGHLQSESLRREFFQKIYLPTLSEEKRTASQDKLYSDFGKILTVAVVTKDVPDRFVVNVNADSPERAAEWVTEYAKKAGDLAKKEVFANVKSDATIKANNLQHQVTIAQESTRKQREDEIVQLQEALLVAKSIGLEKPLLIASNFSPDAPAVTESSMAYMRGSKALEAEISNLQKRQSDDPFIDKIRPKQAALAFYRDLSVDPKMIAVYRQDGVVELSDQPVKPKKLLIVVLALVLGGMLGLMLGFARYLLRKMSVSPGAR